MAEPIDLHRLAGAQQPEWPDREELAKVREELASLMPLVRFEECERLRGQLAQAATGDAFVLQGGDCAETFDGLSQDAVTNKLNMLRQMEVTLNYITGLPMIKVGRIAGQYAKPRSSPTETRGDVTLPAYRGDAVNGATFDPDTRTPDPRRLLRVYRASAATLNLVRSLMDRTDHLPTWDSQLVPQSPLYDRYDRLMKDIDAARRFVRIRGVSPDAAASAEFYASHEALLLDYELPLVRRDPETGTVYAGSGHMVWIGERTRQLDGAHVEFASQVGNPIGVKLGPTATADEVLPLIDKLDPQRQPGRLSLITRMGADRVREQLPALVDKVRASGATPVWICDPMHGNTFVSSNGHKTRHFADIVSELRGFFAVHRDLGSRPGGIHVELTGEDVTECVGGGGDLRVEDLAARYETACDPRLNRVQSLELALIVAELSVNPDYESELGQLVDTA